MWPLQYFMRIHWNPLNVTQSFLLTVAKWTVFIHFNEIHIEYCQNETFLTQNYQVNRQKYPTIDRLCMPFDQEESLVALTQTHVVCDEHLYAVA